MAGYGPSGYPYPSGASGAQALYGALAQAAPAPQPPRPPPPPQPETVQKYCIASFQCQVCWLFIHMFNGRHIAYVHTYVRTYVVSSPPGRRVAETSRRSRWSSAAFLLVVCWYQCCGSGMFIPDPGS
jgi:hypothetical protein